jgi:hypothetical protein
MHISQPTSLDREALELNRASEDSLPMTFVDEAELLRRRLVDGATQQAFANEMGWSKQKAHDYANLSKICPDAWGVVSATLRERESTHLDGAADQKSAGADFTEGCLRAIIHLEPAQQIELVKDLRDGKITKGKFASQADAYRARNEAREWFLSQTGSIDEELIEDGIAGIERGLYDAEWKGSKVAFPQPREVISAPVDS